ICCPASTPPSPPSARSRRRERVHEEDRVRVLEGPRASSLLGGAEREPAEQAELGRGGRPPVLHGGVARLGADAMTAETDLLPLPEPVAVKYPDSGLRDDEHAL